MRKLSVFLGAAAMLAAEGTLPPPAAHTVDFSREVAPLFAKRCQGCHNAGQRTAGLRLDSREGLLEGGYSGAAIIPGKSAESTLIHMVAGTREGRVMPPAGAKLTPVEVGILRAWIDQGANWSAKATAESAAPRAEKPQHWAFVAPRRPEVPEVRRKEWVRNPVDAFILARLEGEGIAPSPEASRETLIRRATLDLTGLLPTPEETAAFLADTRPDAYERLVDGLLASPHYGEKWARHWLDLARYADSDGYEKDQVRPHAWRYRHWLIAALNRDMPFDRFTRETMAGDLLPEPTPDSRIATAFHRNTLTNREGGVDVFQFRFEQVLDRANTVGSVWLGLTFGCAQCHDHKYDPISQKEYYQLYAFFDRADEEYIDAPLPGEMGPHLAGLGSYQAKRRALLAEYNVAPLQAAWEERMQWARHNPGKELDLDFALNVLRVLEDSAYRMLDLGPEKRSARQNVAMTNHFVRYGKSVLKEKYDEAKLGDLQKKLQELETTLPKLSQAPVLMPNPDPVRTHLRLRGDYRELGIEVQPGTPAFLPPLPGEPTRLALGEWLVSPENPLTARVTVNRQWQEIFGRGLVRTSEDFGTQGERPSHPELLDWLAVEFRESGWSLKRLHRMLVLSAAYRQSSNARDDLRERDPANILLARQSRLRLPAEAIRDAALQASGLLDTRIGGPSVRPPQPEGVAALGYANSVKWEESQGPDRYRRGLYVHFQRTTPYPQLMTFDAPDANLTCSRRQRSNTPLQALNLLNDPVFFEAAQSLATQLLRSGGSTADRLALAYRLCLSREPSPREKDRLASYLEQQRRIFERDPEAARTVYAPEEAGVAPEEAATWVMAARALLNLDEFITRE
ncbi:MAG: PSD1 domain-containing protein [Bryobacterales bacterium]|nr:PSD1 domain-containing protein [Bryobacterales bacterium]